MAMTDRATIVGVFFDRRNAQAAVTDLRNAGFSEEQLGVVSHDENEHGAAIVEGDAIATGAITGVAAGAGMGALWGMGIAAGLLPAIGPVIAGGTLAAILASAAAGAAAASLVGALVGMGISGDEAEYYDKEFRAGRTVITVHTDGRAEEARMILDRHGAYDYFSQRETIESPTTAPTNAPVMHRSIDVPVSRDDVTAKPDITREAEFAEPIFEDDPVSSTKNPPNVKPL